MSLQSFFIDNFDSPLVKKRGRKSTGTSASKGKSRRQTIDQSDLENFQNISELSISSNDKKKKDRRETIDPHDLLAFADSSVLSSNSGSSADPLDLQKAVLDDLSLSTADPTNTILSMKSQSMENSQRSAKSSKSKSSTKKGKGSDRRQTIDKVDLMNLIDLDFSCEVRDETISTTLPNDIPKSKDHRRETIDPVDLLDFSNSSGLLSQSGDSNLISKSVSLNSTPVLTCSVEIEAGNKSGSQGLQSNSRSKGSHGKKKKTPNRRETIDMADLLHLNESSMISTRSGSTINPTDVQNILDDLEGASPATTVTMTGLSFDSSIFGRREEESDRSLLPLENFLKIGSPIRANDAASGTTSKFSAAPTLPAFSSALKSCLSSKKPPRDFTISHTASKSVVFGSPQVAEFNKTSPTTKFTPMDKSQAKALFQHTFEEKEEVKEEVDDVTAENERILEEWDRLTQASDCSPQQLVEEDFPFEDFSNEDGSDLSRHHVSNSSMSSIKRRESMLQPHIFDSKLATAAALDCSELEEVEEFTTTVQLPSTLSALMEEVSLEQKKKGFRREEGDEDSTLDDVDEYDDHTEEIETDLRSLLHHIDEKHSFIDLRGDSSASHLADASSASVMPVQIEVEDEDNIRADKSPRKSLMSEIFPMDDGSLSSSNMLEISSAAQLDDDLHQIYQNTSSVSRTSEYSSKQSETEHSILSHLGDVHVEEVPFGSSVKIDLGEGIKIFEDDAVPNSEFENENVEIRVTPLVNNQLMEEVKEEEEEEEMEELEEEESVEELSFIGRKAKLLLEEIQTPPHTAPSVTRSTVKAVDADQLTGLRQRLLSLKPSAVPMVTTTENDHVHRTISLSTQVEREVEKVEQKKSSMPRTPFSSKASSSVSAKKVSTKKKANTPLKLEPTPSITPSDTMKSQKSYPVISQPSAEEWDAIIFTQWCKVFTVVLKMTSLTRTLSSHAHYSTLTGYIHNLVEENFVVATRFMSHLSRFLTNQLSLLWQHYITLPSSPLPPSCESIYREQFAVASSSSYQELMENVRESMSEYYLLRHQSSQWESLWLELINSSLFEGIARLRNHHGTRDILPITANSDRFMAKALSVNAAEEIKGEKKASASQQLLDRIIRSKGEKRSQQMELQQKIKETMTKNSIINRFSFFRIVALLADLIEVQIFLSEEAKVILQFHLESSGKGEKAVVHGIESIDIDLSFSDAIKKSEKSFIATYFADVIASEQWKGPLNPNDLNELDKISDIHLLLEKLTGYVIALRAGLNIVRKIEKLDGSFSIVRDINSEDDAVTLPSVYIEYSHSQFPVTMTLMSFLSYAQDKTHAFISSQDSMLLFLKDLRDYMNIAMH